MSRLSFESKYIFDHIVLPPKLPQQQEHNVPLGDAALGEFVLQSIKEYDAKNFGSIAGCWRSVERLFATWATLHGPEEMDSELLDTNFGRMEIGDSIALHLKAQNACVLVHRPCEQTVSFDLFEVSARNSDIMSTLGRMKRRFPGQTVTIDDCKFNDPNFRGELSKMLSAAYSEELEEAAPAVKKAESVVHESRDTFDPKMITKYLAKVLAACGHHDTVHAITKHVREDVLWDDCEIPWRRSPTWLAMRVSLQLHLRRLGEQEKQYKEFMLFLACRTTDLLLRASATSEELHVASAKVAGRLRKLRDTANSFAAQEAAHVVFRVDEVLEERWSNIQTQRALKVPLLDCHINDRLHLQKSRATINAAIDREMNHLEPEQFQPNHPLRTRGTTDELPDLNTTLKGLELTICLADMEQWVSESMKTWAADGSRSSSDCRQLSTLMQKYSLCARKVYEGCAREMSSALLSLLDMWVSLDKIALRLVPMMADYPSEIPVNLLEPLLLPRLDDMERAKQIEDYLWHRYDTCNPENPSVFADPHPRSLEVRYFEKCEVLQQLRLLIEEDANQARQQKCKELKDKEGRRQRLLAEANRLQCEFYLDHYGNEQHDYCCLRCSKTEAAKSIEIRVHEWPLPERHKDVQHKATVFELSPPVPFAMWRDATWHIIHDLGRDSTASSPDIHQTILDYEALQGFTPQIRRQVCIGSTSKSFLASHYRTRKLPVSPEAICKNNGLYYRRIVLNERALCTAMDFSPPNFRRHCRSELEHGLYSPLQRMVDTTAHTTNEVLASQDNRPANLTIAEYIAFGFLRAGERIQWYNMLRELGDRCMSLSDPSVVILFQQAAWQLGTAQKNCARRTAHAVFLERGFSDKLLEVLRRKYEQVAPSSKDSESLVLVATLASRALSLTSSALVAEGLTSLLRHVRTTALDWLRKLQQGVGRQLAENVLSQQQLVVIKMAVLVLLTFDVESTDNSLSNQDDVSSYVEASIVLRNSLPVDIKHLPNVMRSRLVRLRKIAHSLEASLRSLITESAVGVNRALTNVWSGAMFTSGWKVLPRPSDRWIMNTTSSSGGQRTINVHYNLISGEVMADGRPFGRLPSGIEEDELFHVLFGKAPIHVAVSSMRGMDYMMLNAIEGHQVHFALREGKAIVRATYNGETLELLRPKIFDGDLPIWFHEHCVHWLRLRDGMIEFRARSTPLQPSEKNWRLSLLPSPSLSLAGRRVLDKDEEMRIRIVHILSSVEAPGHIHVTLGPNGVTEAYLNRRHLRFIVNGQKKLECPQLDAIVDDDQAIGCLVGLDSKLVLRKRLSGSTKRMVIVPFGELGVEKFGDHVTVVVLESKFDGPNYLCLWVNQYLRRLDQPPGRHAALYIAYLHAVTTHPCADPFTQRTGMEEAFTRLSEPLLRTGKPLCAKSMFIAEEIAKLTPRRVYYPDHLQVMQQTGWKVGMDATAQHENYYTVVNDIVQDNARFSFLHEAVPLSLEVHRGSSDLQQRAKMRNASYRNFEVARVEPSPERDLHYEGRDSFVADATCQRVYSFCSSIEDWVLGQGTPVDLEFIRTWSSVGGYGSRFEVRPIAQLFGLEISENWGALYDLCRRHSKDAKYSLMFLLGALVYQDPKHLPWCQILLAVAMDSTFSALPAPYDGCFRLDVGSDFNNIRIENLLRINHVSLSERALRGLSRKEREQKHAEHETRLQQEILIATNELARQWPCKYPQQPSLQFDLLNLEQHMQTIRLLFEEWHRNRLYLAHLDTLERLLPKHGHHDLRQLCETVEVVAQPFSVPSPKSPSLDDLLSQRTPPSLEAAPPPFEFYRPREKSRSSEKAELYRVLQSLKEGDFDPEYLLRLEGSLRCFEEIDLPLTPSNFPADVYGAVKRQVADFSERCDRTLASFKACLGDVGCGTDTSTATIIRARLGPMTSPQTLLSVAARRGSCSAWVYAAISYGELIADLQRAHRLQDSLLKGDVHTFYREAENPGSSVWQARDYPEWLLLEIEKNIRIREVQASLALLIMSGRQNSVFQLNMGEGKSSVIVPMLAAATAKGSELRRLLTLRPLLQQMTSSITHTLGRLINKRVYSLPFHRQTPINEAALQKIFLFFKECKEEAGLLVMLPEHMLSFRLMGYERMLEGSAVAEQLIKMDQWLRENCCDILDESDEILSVKFQLVYAIGTQIAVDGSADRWAVTLSVLSLIGRKAPSLAAKPGVQIAHTQGSYPVVRIHNEDVCNAMLKDALSDIVNIGLQHLSFFSCTSEIRTALQAFIGDLDVQSELEAKVMEKFQDGPKLNCLWTLRGLFAHGILRYCFGKRWCVDYGLDLGRCLMAVPYKAKGIPSPRSVFSHPDVAIVLTCLSYYQTGLSKSQLRESFVLLQRESNAADEYSAWCRCAPGLPKRLASLPAVNIEDEEMLDVLHTHLNLSVAAINFFVSKVVFPHEAKEFPWQLSMSAWDIPSSVPDLATNGFSGTNDNQTLLPLSITQTDVPGLEHTNAMVLTTILAPRNRGYEYVAGPSGTNIDTRAFLSLLSKQHEKFQVLIDVGAQILDLTNYDVAKCWLEEAPEAEAAIYFDESHVLQVVDRHDTIQDLSTSTCLERLDDCVVYLDEAHARGVDITLPDHFKAAIYLGPETGKDKLVQACMRMRKLEHSQCVKFFAPQEVHDQILALRPAGSRSEVDSSDVIRWSIRQTQEQADKHKQLWYRYGLAHARRRHFCDALDEQLKESQHIDSSFADRLNEELLETGALTLPEMYSTARREPAQGKQDWRASELAVKLERLAYARGMIVGEDRAYAEEHEREIAPEVEQERELQRPLPKTPLQHNLAAEVRHFAETGYIMSFGNDAILPMFEVLRKTSARSHIADLTGLAGPYITADYADAVRLTNLDDGDDYLRPVRWVITSNVTDDILIVSPFEANELMLIARASTRVAMHLYSPRTSKDMFSFTNLQFYSITGCDSPTVTQGAPPRSSLHLLNLFAGMTYFDSRDHYRNFCAFLGVVSSAIDDQDISPCADGFVIPADRRLLDWAEESPFQTSPVPLVNRILALRSGNDDVRKTHVGRVVNAVPISPDEFDTGD